MPSIPRLLGIDTGSVSITLVEIDAKKKMIQSDYRFHHGNINGTLREMLSRFHPAGEMAIACTASTPSLLTAARTYDNRVSMITAGRHFHDDFGSILFVGGEKFGILHFDSEGNYRNFNANTSCAAGTGGFLDQQAERLQLKSSDELSRIALTNVGNIPKIATRCAVFAKTDLAHAQQMGYTLPEICDGLCLGLAKNIIDTLGIDETTRAPILFTGGVSLNRAVVKHLRALTGKTILTDHTLFFGAFGAASLLLDETPKIEGIPVRSLNDIFLPEKTQRPHAHEKLELRLSDYPDFASPDAYVYEAESAFPVEVDVYHRPATAAARVHLGIDIGSTSTKAVLLNTDKTVLAGFYTLTAGKPIPAVQGLFAAIHDMAGKNELSLGIISAGTTGAGRKFIGKLFGADRVVDEISAHARAAVEIDPAVDTIIEIGGQDSKFTTLRNGQVTFSLMNNVCAAGTGSFIAEQARKLGCPLSEFAARAELSRAPLTSDRCTVFMERDLNHYLSEGYEVNALLAATLHSVRDNYLTKVAIEASIGENILFLGATAKNRALVAAFEQRLAKPIQVSRYSHLTGGMGVALMLRDEGIAATRFKGLDLRNKEIPLRSEVCDFCTNHCKITVAEIDGEAIAYGFLCGRDYDTNRFVSNNRSGFDLLKNRKKAFAFEAHLVKDEGPFIGMPAALHMLPDIPFWKYFFNRLGIRTVTSEKLKSGVADGKHFTGAGFCSPMTALHGHVHSLMEKSDYIFLPIYLEKKAKQKGKRRQYCYYTQFSTALISSLGSMEDRKRFLRPMVHYLYNSFFTKAELYHMLKSISARPIGFFEVSAAFDQAQSFMESRLAALKEAYAISSGNADDFHVVLLGRPYTVLSEEMNKSIPSLFGAHGVKAFYQDMLTYADSDIQPIAPLLREIHWHYATEILESAAVVAGRKGAYPVLITAFGCSPDSFVIEYFKRIMESHQKPYLILQLDEHDSNVGYETRIEAAIRSFQNHHARNEKRPKPVGLLRALHPDWVENLEGKTLLLPNWDPISCKLIAANLRGLGLDARVLEERPSHIGQSLRCNSGQCLPLTLIAHEFIDYIETRGLPPARTALWLPMGEIACNLKLYPHHIKQLLNAHANGMEKAGVYVGKLSMVDISLSLPANNYFAYMFGGFIRKMGCIKRPYEMHPGETDRAIMDAVNLLEITFEQNRSKEKAVEEVVSRFEQIETYPDEQSMRKPKVAIFGDLYARDNHVINQDLIHFIESHGAEVITVPYSEYLKLIAGTYHRKWFMEGHYLDVFYSSVFMASVIMMEKAYYRMFERVLKEPIPAYDESPEKILSKFNIRIENTGESMDNILKIYYIKKLYPDVSLFVQTSPSFCCPGMVTEAMSREIEKTTGVPVATITYDGTGGNKNEIIIPYLTYPRSHLDPVMETDTKNRVCSR
ncbi:MAG: acyl-CoA dehydratase activase [Pseudomonadota bacterium]